MIVQAGLHVGKLLTAIINVSRNYVALMGNLNDKTIYVQLGEL